MQHFLSEITITDVSQYSNVSSVIDITLTKIQSCSNENVKALECVSFDPTFLPKNIKVEATNRRVLKPKKGSIQINEIREFDVISGRGGMSNHSNGNKHFRYLIDVNRSKYKSKTNRHEKAEVSKFIRSAIQAVGGRFLFQDD